MCCRLSTARVVQRVPLVRVFNQLKMPFTKAPFSQLTLYYHPASPPSRACLMLLRLLDINVLIKQVDLQAGQQNDEEFLKLNPAHQIPVLTDGDFVVTESRAIMAYIVNSRKPGSVLYPVNSKLRARVDERLFFDATVLFEQNAMAIRCVLFGNATKIPPERKQKVNESIEMLEGFLANDEWFAGANMTIADISILAIITQLDCCGYDFTKHPKLSAWYKRCKSLSCFKENATGAKPMGDLFKSRLEEGGGFN